MPIGQVAFTGFIPKLPTHMQPDNGATVATNGDFAHGELRALPADGVVTSPSIPSTPSIVSALSDATTTGAVVLGFSYATTAVRAPNPSDTHKRYYYIDAGGTMRVVANPAENVVTVDPSGVKAGVPPLPEGGTTITAVQNFADRSSTEGLTFSFSRFWETDGKVAQLETLTGGDLVQVSPGDALVWDVRIPYPTTSTAFNPVAIQASGFTIGGVDYSIATLYPGYTTAKLTINSAVSVTLTPPSGGANIPYVPHDGDLVWDTAHTKTDLQAKIRELMALQGITSFPSAGVKLLAKDASGMEIFTLYPGGSSQAINSNTAIIPGGISMELAKKEGSADWYRMSIKLSAIEERYYALTVVNDFGEESAPLLSNSIDLHYFQDANYTATVPLSAFTGYEAVNNFRLYRTASAGGSNAEYLLVYDYLADHVTDTNGSLASAGGNITFTYKDHKKTEKLGYALQTLPSWAPPPAALKGLCAMRNGILAAFKDNELHVAEPYRPYAWRSVNILSFQKNIKAICPFSNGLLVFTSGQAHFVSGASSDQLAQNQIAGAYGVILNAQAVVETPFGAVFATDDGLCMTDGNQASTEMSLKLFTRQDWKALIQPFPAADARLIWWDGRLVVYAVGVSTGLMIDMDEAGGAVTYLDGLNGIKCHAVYPDPNYIFYIGANNALYSAFLNTVSGLRAVSYESRTWELPRPVSFSALQIRQEGATTVQVYADDVQKHTETCTGNKIIRLPSGFMATRWKYKLTRAANESGAVHSVYLGLSIGELKGV